MYVASQCLYPMKYEVFISEGKVDEYYKYQQTEL